VGRELGVRFVLEGSIRRVGDRVRVTAQFIDARSGAHVWAETLNRPMDDIVKAQDEIGRSIVAGITSHLFHNVAFDGATDTLEAWELRARAVTRWASAPEAQSSEEAGRLSGLALEKDPQAVANWALFAKGAAMRWLNNPSEDFEAARTKAHELIDHAMGLAPHDPYVFSSLGAVHLWTGEPRKAVPLLRRALAMLPANIGIHLNLATALFHSGQTAVALAELETLGHYDLPEMVGHARDLSLADVNVSLKNYLEAEVCARKAMAGTSRNAWALVTLAAALCGQHRVAEAQEALREVQTIMPGFTASFYERATRILLSDQAMIGEKLALIAPAWPQELASAQGAATESAH
jgi:tetratricopeptide (TPR) repeat protein